MDEGPNDPLRCDMAQANGVDADGKCYEQLEALVDANLADGTWLVFVGHDVGRCGKQSMPADVLEELCSYVAACDELWIDTVTAIGSYLARRREDRHRRHRAARAGGAP